MTAAAWADYMERNRRSNVIYDWLPITRPATATPCHVCRTRLTQRASGLCKDCEERTSSTEPVDNRLCKRAATPDARNTKQGREIA